jgi:hypothetical protein
MSELVVTTTTTANGTTDHTIKTGNSNGPVAVVYANGYVGVSNTTGSDFLIADANVTYSNTQKGVFRGNMSAGPIEGMAIHNLIVNGGMEISQENGNSAGNTTGYYPVDQKLFEVGGFDCDVWQSTVTPSNNYSYSIEANVQIQDASVGASDYLDIRENIEGTFSRKLGWGTTDASPLTVGFWSRCSSDLTYSYWKTSSNNDTSFLKELSVTGNTWTWNCFTIPGETSGAWYSNTSIGIKSGITLSIGSTYANTTANSWIAGLYFGTTTQDNFMALGAGNTFHTTGWVAIPGEHTIESEDAHKFLLPYDYELQRCQRYYFTEPGTIYGARYASTSGFVGIWGLPVEMRSNPSLSYSSVATETGLTAYSEQSYAIYLMTSTSPTVTGLVANARL